MVRVQANPSLSKRNWSRKSRPTIPWYPFCVLVLVLQIAAVLFVNRPASSDDHKQLVNRRKQRYSNHAPSFPPRAETRPEAELPANVKLRTLEDKIRHDFAVKQVKACRWVRSSSNAGVMRSVPDYDCDKEDRVYILHNPLEDHERYVMCGESESDIITVPPKGFVSIEKPCHDMMNQWRLFKSTPIIQEASKMPPVKISTYQEADGFFPSDETEEDGMGGMGIKEEPFPCDVPCAKQMDDFLLGDLSIIGTPWLMRFSMESAINYSDLEFSTSAHKHNHFFATTNFDSEVPLPYFSWAEYSIQSPAVQYDKVIKGASFIATNCESMNDREMIVGELKRILRVDALGACLNNAEPPPGSSRDDIKSMKRQYLFHLAFENSNEKDYITEKLWATFESGTIPVYMGAPNVQEHAPPNSIISWHDFESTQALGEYLNKVANDRALYESYHAWRQQPLPESFHKMYDFTKVHSVCRICRWAHARMYGYTFDHSSQAIQEPALPRQLCLDPASQLLTHPVKERWLRGAEILRSSTEASGTCQSQGFQQAIQIGTWTRTISNWDGVLDIEIAGTGEDGVYQLTVPIEGTPSQQLLSGPNGPVMWTVQNSQSRMTILTSWAATLTSNGPVISIEMRAQKTMKIRIIVEDLDRFYDGGENESNYFGDLLMKDFLNPMEQFLIEL